MIDPCEYWIDEVVVIVQRAGASGQFTHRRGPGQRIYFDREDIYMRGVIVETVEGVTLWIPMERVWYVKLSDEKILEDPT